MSLKEKINGTSSILSEQDVFLSCEMKKYLEDKTKYVARQFGALPPMINIYFRPSSEVAYTDGRLIYINAAHPLFDGSRTERFQKICGAVAHEMSHCAFTNFAATKKYLSCLFDGKLYPSFPFYDSQERIIESEYNENADSLAEFLAGNIGFIKSKDPAFSNREWLSRLAQNLLNILEDGRIEYIFSSMCFSHKTLYYGLGELVKAQMQICPDLDEILLKVDEKELYTYEALTSLMLHYVRFGEIKGYDHARHKDEGLVKAFFKVMPLLDSFLESMNAQGCLTILNKVIITLWQYILEFAKDLNDKFDENELSSGAAANELTQRTVLIPGSTNDNSDAMSDNFSGTDSSSFTKTNPTLNPDPTPLPSGEGEASIARPEAETPEEVTESEGTKEVEEENSLPQNSMLETDDDAVSNSKEVSDDSENTSVENTAAVGNCESSGGEMPPERDNPLLDNSTSDLAKSASLDLNKVSSFIAESKRETAFSDIVKEDNLELNRSIKQGKIHEGVSCEVIRPNVTENNIFEYNLNKMRIEALVKDMLRRSDFLYDDNTAYLVRNKYSGSRFNAGSIAKGDYKYFSRERDVDAAYDLDVIILCDESGSMMGVRNEACKAAAICCYKYMSAACGNNHVAVYGHNTCGKTVFLNCYADFDYPDTQDQYRIMNISAGGSNRDGYALRFAKEKISPREAERKLIIIISDGQPADWGYYGKEACDDIKEVLREANREGIMYIAAAIGDDQDVIRSIYGDKHFLDISKLDELPSKLICLLFKLIRG